MSFKKKNHKPPKYDLDTFLEAVEDKPEEQIDEARDDIMYALVSVRRGNVILHGIYPEESLERLKETIYESPRIEKFSKAKDGSFYIVEVNVGVPSFDLIAMADKVGEKHQRGKEPVPPMKKAMHPARFVR